MIIDTHAHYDDEAFDSDRDQLLAGLTDNNIYAAVNMGASLDGVEKSVELAHKYPQVYAGVGLHPDEVGILDTSVLNRLRELAQDPKVVCIGEIGLDYHWNIETPEVQKAAFEAQMKLAIETGLPINVHSRNAAQDTFDMIKSVHAGTTGGIIHCYSGSREMAKEYVKMGYMLGIGGVVTYKNGKTLKKVVEDIPLEHLVTETDSPYLCPEPHRGKRNDSRNICHVIDMIAELKGMDRQIVEETLLQNAKRIYTRMK